MLQFWDRFNNFKKMSRNHMFLKLNFAIAIENYIFAVSKKLLYLESFFILESQFSSDAKRHFKNSYRIS
jgi:hypothetical protein